MKPTGDQKQSVFLFIGEPEGSREPNGKSLGIRCDHISAARKLRALATAVRQKAEAVLDCDRQTNTRRRAAMAAAIQDRARADLAVADTLDTVAEAHESGQMEGALYVSRITNRADLELLNGAAHDARYRWCQPSGHRHENVKNAPLEPHHIAFAKLPGFPIDEDERRILAARLAAQGALALGQKLDGLNPISLEVASALMEIEAREVKSCIPWVFGYSVGQLKRFKRLGVVTDDDLRAALAEYAPLQAAKQAESPVQRMERELIGTRPGIDFFPTPPPLAARLAREANILPGMAVLEPSAGKGDLLDAIRAEEPTASLTAVEWSHQLSELLRAKGYPAIGADFMSHVGEYDRIVMNPPFSNGQDMRHVRHAFKLLKPGGRLVSIMSAGVFCRSGRAEIEFRDWLEKVGAICEPLPEGSFKSAFRPTSVSTHRIIVDKAATPAVERISEPSALAA